METIKKYKLIIVLVIGFILGLLMTCFQKDNLAEVSKETKVEYIVKTTTDTIKIDSIQVDYKYKDKVIILTQLDSIIKDFKPKDYSFTYDKIIESKSKKTKVNMQIKGWGNITNADFNITETDSTKIITNTITKTIEKNNSGLFISGSFNTQKEPAIGLDYIYKNKWIIGTQVQYDNIIQKPIVGLKVGFKL